MACLGETGLTQPTCLHGTADLELFPFCGISSPAPKGLPSKTPGLLKSLPCYAVEHLGNPALSLKPTPKYQLYCFPELSIPTTSFSLLCQLFPPGSWQVGIASCGHVLNLLSLISAPTEPALPWAKDFFLTIVPFTLSINIQPLFCAK